MKEDDPLSSVLREWQAPEPSAALDARVRAAYGALDRPSPWRRLWSARVSIPVPVLAALLLMAAAWWLQFRSRPAAHPATAAPLSAAYMTRIETAGFKPLPDGATRVIRAQGVRQ